ncbi:hypothetical protein IJ182_02495 [bacterium]|nr:hypothetical protein [bacterium]
MKKILLVLSILILFSNITFAETDTQSSTINFGKINKKVFKYIQKANEAKTFQEKENNYILAAKHLKNKKYDDILLKAGIYYLIANDAKREKDYKTAEKWYNNSFSYMEENNIEKDNYLAFGCLMNILKIEKKEHDKNIFNETLLKIEDTQLGLAKTRKDELLPVYGMLFEYYNNNDNKQKADEYEKIIKSYN